MQQIRKLLVTTAYCGTMRRVKALEILEKRAQKEFGVRARTCRAKTLLLDFSSARVPAKCAWFILFNSTT